jgi:hypothetical protein
MRVTNNKITELKEHEIFVFGANERGAHGAGAAKLAVDNFGAILGQGYGLQGRSFGIPTKDRTISTLPISKIQKYVTDFLIYALNNPQYTFLVTAIGTGLAGYSAKEIAPLFILGLDLENVHFPERFWDVLNRE